ncbi:NUDIX hydrolase [Tessaracoccus lubricantis]|uniref:NUDIX hydrolase n=1 Tax=Tessaracoccus lubricantis TaxID=545543 RepID=A0ABP9F2S0_9ACTN
MELIAWVILRDGGGRVLLARRCGTALADGLWNLPGGHIEDGEPAVVGAVREAEEEVGAGLAVANLAHVGLQRWAGGFNFFFESTAWQGSLAPGEATSELAWFALDALPDDCLPWLPAALHAHLVEGRFYVETLG